VIDIVAPVLDIETGTADLGRRARVERQGKKITVTLDATVLFAKDSARLNAKARARLNESEQSETSWARFSEDHRVYRRSG
jgi:outer membrane protein OmpA-like peptidoglycan-associated protein